MELSPFQRFAAFAVVVLVLAGLGAYLFVPHWISAAGRHRVAHHGTARQAPTQHPPSPAASGSASPDIYQWLPFTESGLASAAGTTTAFAGHYGTYSYTESAQAYLSPMRPLMTTPLAGVLGRAFAAPGLPGTSTPNNPPPTPTPPILPLPPPPPT